MGIAPELEEEIERLEATVGRLRAALEPFADVASRLVEKPPALGEYLFITKRQITWGGQGDFTMDAIRRVAALFPAKSTPE